MSLRGQKIALFLALLVIVAFVASFVAGLRGREDDGERGVSTLQWQPDSSRVRIEVLNGAGRSGLARDATKRLRDRGFDVVYFGNASEFGHDSSVVLDRVGKEEAAREVAAALGIANVRSDPDSTLLLEVTVILGQDWPPVR